MYRTARTLYRLSREGQKPDTEREPGYQERDMTRIRERLTRIDRQFDPDGDRAFWRSFIVQYASTPLEHDFGIIHPHAVVDHEFRLENNGNRPWTIARLERSCNCTVGRPSSPTSRFRGKTVWYIFPWTAVLQNPQDCI